MQGLKTCRFLDIELDA